MIAPGYDAKQECKIVEQDNKHHCHVPPEVWGLTPETVCAICMMKNHALFVAAAISIAEVNDQKVIPFRKPRLCESCNRTQLQSLYWEAGERACSQCRNESVKLEQQCGR